MTLARIVTFTLHPHDNADSLSIAKIDGSDWQCVVRTDQWVDVRRGVYITIDALLDPTRLEFAFLKDKATKSFVDGRPAHRLKTARLRGKLSQGLLVPVPDGLDHTSDIDAQLGIERYEPAIPLGMQGNQIRCPGSFVRYPHIENAKNFPELFVTGEDVRVTCKIHGTSFRAGLVDDGREDGPIYIVGTHATARATDGTNLYSRMAKTHAPEEKLREVAKTFPFSTHFIVLGEIFGSRIQDLQYGCKPGEQKLRVFDVLIDHKYQSWETVGLVASQLGLETVPLLYRGPFDREKVLALRDGPSTLPGANHMREGVVVTAEPEREAKVYDASGALMFDGRAVLKYVSDVYLERSGAKDGH